MDWFLYDMGLRREKVKGFKSGFNNLHWKETQIMLKSEKQYIKVATQNAYFNIQHFFTERMCFERQHATKLVSVTLHQIKATGWVGW